MERRVGRDARARVCVWLQSGKRVGPDSLFFLLLFVAWRPFLDRLFDLSVVSLAFRTLIIDFSLLLVGRCARDSGDDQDRKRAK